MTAAFAITVGQGKNRPQGHLVALAPPPVDGVAAALSAQPRSAERWWSPHSWERDYRLSDKWRASMGAVIDVDCDELITKNGKSQKKKRVPGPAAIARLLELVRAGELPGSLFHLTPHGARVVFVYELVCTHREMQVAASKGAAALVERALASAELFDFQIDPCSWDLARYYFTPTAVVDGLAREAEQIVMHSQPYEVDALAAEEPPPEAEPLPIPARLPGRQAQSFLEAKSKWVSDHPLDVKRHSGDCPMCGHKGCFGHLPEDGQQWFCWSSNHPDGQGLKGERGHHGDALDLEAALRGCTTKEVLFRDGYWSMTRSKPRQSNGVGAHAAPATAVAQVEPEHQAEVVPIDSGRRAYFNNSYLTVLQIVEHNDRNVLDSRKLEWNEMTGRPTLNRQPIEDDDETRVRSEIERRFVGSVDQSGRQRGLKAGLSDIRAALVQVARQRPFHPVRDYLRGLTWDGTERIDHMVDDILGAERTELNLAIVRRFMTSAVARALDPGCKVDTVLVLVGEQGAYKSTFFRELANGWYTNTAVDVTDKDSFMILREAWLYEWGELGVARRANIDDVKNFLSSQIDNYRPPYGHNPISVKRSCVIVGSTNNPEFLIDETGNRRFWPIKNAPEIALALLVQQREQLWAEAVHLYNRHLETRDKFTGASEFQWWLSPREKQLLEQVHYEHSVSDAWEKPVLDWAQVRLFEFTTADVIAEALSKPKGMWTRGDEMRVAAILRRHGWKTGNKPFRGARPWLPAATK